MEGSSRSRRLGLPGERPADGQHLLLAPGQGPRFLLAPLAEDGEQLVDVGDVVGQAAAVRRPVAPTTRLSSTDRVGKSCRPSGTWQRPLATIFSGAILVMSAPW